VIAGQISQDQAGNIVGPDDFTLQFQTVYANLRTVLESVEATFADVVSLRTFLVRVEDIVRFQSLRRELYPKLFPTDEYPPNTAVVVSQLFAAGLLLEVEAIAVV
jgi:enamine deaminase RidA (YjgF/YER057c/UK114 family)